MKWISAFSYLPIPAFEEGIEAENMVQLVIFDNNLNGEQVRIRFSNQYGKQPLVLHRVVMGIVAHGRIEGRKGFTFQDRREVTFQGKQRICLEAGEEYDSDAIELSVSAGCKIGVFIYIKERQKIGSFCSLWSRKGAKVLCTIEKDLAEGSGSTACEEELLEKAMKMSEDGQTMEDEMRFCGFSGVRVWAEEEVKTIAAFGDSITHMSCVTNALCRRLMDERPGKAALQNHGIGGNRLLHDAAYIESISGNGGKFGQAGLKRLEQELFGGEKADIVLFLEGINDIMHPIQFHIPKERVTAEELIEGYREAAAIVHRHNAKIFGATMTPCGNEDYPKEWLEAFEEIRCAANDAIRNGQLGYDGFFDYDAAVRNEKNPAFMKTEYQIGDGLHPNDAGGEAMAALVDWEKMGINCGGY